MWVLIPCHDKHHILLDRDETGDSLAVLLITRLDDQTGCLWPGLDGAPPCEMSGLEAPHQLSGLILHLTDTIFFPSACIQNT